MSKFKNYIRLKKRYDEIFEQIFEGYYKRGYFGDVSKEDIKEIQYEWFHKVINILENKEVDKLEPYITNHNNKLTRAFFAKLTGSSIKTASADAIKKLLGEIKNEE